MAEESDEESQKFISNMNTFPRLCNIILQFPDAVIRSSLLASKYALQNKETNQNQPVFVETCAKFNDANFDSGGLVSNHLDLSTAKIDTERHNPGKISAKFFFKLFKRVIKEYAAIMVKFTASGKHNGHDFINYCNGNRNALYLHLMLAKLGDLKVSIPFFFSSFLSLAIIVNIIFYIVTSFRHSSTGIFLITTDR